MTQEPYAWRRALPRSCGLLSLWLIVVCSLPAAVLAQAPAFLVKDIDVQPVTASSYPRGFLTVGSTTFFITDTDNGNALWTTDGSERGTVRVKDFTPSPDGQSPFVVAATHDKALLVAGDESSGYELWASDGTEPGTLRLADISPGPGSPLLNWFTEVDGTVFFFALVDADDGTPSTQLWKTDGTTLGTVLVAEKGWATPWGLIDFDGTLVFASQTELWESDGTSAGTMRVVDFPVSIATLTVAGNVLFTFTHAPSGGFDLWKSDSTAAGTVLLKSSLPYPDAVAEVNDSLFFTTWDYNNGRVGLWKSDGTPTGTALVKDFAPVGEGPITVRLGAVNGSLFFVVQDGMTGVEFWKSDGTSPGTVRLKELPGPVESLRVIAVNGLLFTLLKDAAGIELWRTDGTEDGTLQLASLPGPSDWVSYANFFDVEGRLFLGLPDQLWTSDGTPARTILLTTGNPSELASANGQVLFAGRDSRSGVELWTTDGTPVGTMLLANLAPDCTTPTCGDAIVNQAAGEECDDGNTQNGDCCSATCIFESSGSACGDGSACNGEETCDGAGGCQPGIPLPAGTPCGYGDICAGDANSCDGSGTCRFGPPLACDDGNPYTTDWCEPSSGCLHAREPGPIGDCNGDAVVSVNELVAMVDDALGESPGMSCPAGDANLDQRITVDEIIAATKNAMNAPCDLCDDP